MRTVLLLTLSLFVSAGHSKTLTYNQSETINLCDQGIPTDQRATNTLIARGNTVYGVTSGDKCHVFRFDPATSEVKVLATLEGTNTVLKGFTLHGDSLYVGTMWTQEQIWLEQRRKGNPIELEDANLVPVEDSWNTGHLYRVTGIDGDNPKLEDLGIPVAGQGIHTLTVDASNEVVYGVTSPNGRLFTYDIHSGEIEEVTFGTTYAHVSNHMVAFVELERELVAVTPGEAEWNGRLIPPAMHVRGDGTFWCSGWHGQILKYDPTIEEASERITVIGYIPSVPGRQYWNRIDAIVEQFGKLYLGTSDGYIVRLDPETGEMENFGKPIRAIEVQGMAFSPLDGKLYGVSGGGLEGMSRLWCLDTARGTFEVDIPALEVFKNRHEVGDVVCTDDGTFIFSESMRVANLITLKPGEKKEWEKSGYLKEDSYQETPHKYDDRDRFKAHKKLEVEVFPIPSELHGGSGYTAIQADRDGKIYVGTAYYGSSAQLTQLDPKTASWRRIFKQDDLTHEYGHGMGMPGKIHTKLRLGNDGKIYGAMKQGYEFHYTIRPDVGEAPEGTRGSQYTCHFFSYDPATDEVKDLGPGWPQEGITSFDVDTNRGFVYGVTVPGVMFLVLDMKTGRVWNAGQVGQGHPSRYMPMDPGTGKVYQRGETTPEGRNFMTVWDPEEFRLRDIEIVPEEGFEYKHSYASECGPAGTNTLYGCSGEDLFVMDLDDSKDGKFHVRPVCYIGVEGETVSGWMYGIERGPDDRLYWCSAGGFNVPTAIFAWDPKTETKTYLGSCALGGEFLKGGTTQGICLDPEGNLALHMLYSHVTEEQQKHWSVPEDFFYEDITPRDYYLGYPTHREGTFYAVYYLKNAVGIR